MAKKIEPKFFEGINAIIGNPGKGKTYLLQKLALEYNKKGYIVVLMNCGWTLEGAVHIELSSDLLGVYLNPSEREERIAVFVDEANSLWPSRDWAKTDKKELDYFAMFRHAGISAFYYTTQGFDDVETKLRSKTEFIWKCGFMRPLRLFYHRKFSKTDYIKMEGNPLIKAKPYGIRLFFARTLATSYNTYARYDKVSSLADQLQDIFLKLQYNDSKKLNSLNRGRLPRWVPSVMVSFLHVIFRVK